MPDKLFELIDQILSSANPLFVFFFMIMGLVIFYDKKALTFFRFTRTNPDLSHYLSSVKGNTPTIQLLKKIEKLTILEDSNLPAIERFKIEAINYWHDLLEEEYSLEELFSIHSFIVIRNKKAQIELPWNSWAFEVLRIILFLFIMILITVVILFYNKDKSWINTILIMGNMIFMILIIGKYTPSCFFAKKIKKTLIKKEEEKRASA